MYFFDKYFQLHVVCFAHSYCLFSETLGVILMVHSQGVSEGCSLPEVERGPWQPPLQFYAGRETSKPPTTLKNGLLCAFATHPYLLYQPDAFSFLADGRSR